MLSTLEIEQQRNNWDKSLGLTVGNPFTHVIAETEPSLAHFAVMPQFATGLTQPGHTVVFGNYGSGKTALCLSVAARVRKDPASLGISYTPIDFANDVTGDLLEDQIVRLGAGELLVRLSQYPDARSSYQLALAKGLFETTLGTSRYWKFRLPNESGKPTDTHLFEKLRQRLEDTEALLFTPSLGGFVDVLRHMGFSQTYLLVDSIDGQAKTANNPSAMVQVLTPIVNLVASHPDQVWLKAFLPSLLYDDVHRKKRGEFFPYLPKLTHHLRWGNDDIEAMLNQRLAYYSDGRLTDMSGLCAEDAFTTRELIDHLPIQRQGNPREAVHIASLTYWEHIRSQGYHGKLNMSDLEVAAARYQAEDRHLSM